MREESAQSARNYMSFFPDPILVLLLYFQCIPCLLKVTSESKTVATVFDKLADKMDRHFSTTIIQYNQAGGAMKIAHQILEQLKDDGYGTELTLDLDDAWQKRAIESRNNETLYFVLVNELLDFARERLTKPKNFHFALFILSYLSKCEKRRRA